MILLSNPVVVEDEINIIHSLFEEGLHLLHVRKPDFSNMEMAQFIHQIKLEFRPNLILHSHHELAEDFGINRFHFSEKLRKNDLEYPARFPKPCRYKNVTKSTSTHSIKDFNALENIYDYAFLSPVFKSISKQGYHPTENLIEALKARTNFKTKVIALGGINSENIEKVLDNGFDNVALLGAIWNNNNPIKQFKLCQKIVHSYLV